MKKIIIILMFGILVLTLNSCKVCCVPGVEPKGLITEDQAAALEANYLNKRKQIENGSASIMDEPRDFFWKISEIENYICYAKQKAKDQGKTLSGLRFYLGAKPLDSVTNNLSSLTLYIIPTSNIETNTPTVKTTSSKMNATSSASGNEINDSGANVNIDGVKGLDFSGGGNPPNVYRSQVINTQ